MTDDKITAENVEATPAEMPAVDVVASDAATAAPAQAPTAPLGGTGGDDRGGRRSFAKNPRRQSRTRTERPKQEYDQRIIGIRRVTRVVAGGRRFSFSVTIVAGNHKGAVGVGTGKAGDTALAVEKAYRSAVKHKIQVPVTSTNSIAHDVEAKYSSGRVLLYPAPGRGVIAGGAVRDVLQLAGITDVGGKILSPSKNKLNNAQAAIKALSRLKPQRVRDKR